jgi:indolepyruvate ferredoxin oxidoreductase, alpha subunit
MSNKVVDILTSFNRPHKVSAIGNEAIARGALEAGVDGVFSYPGTPSTEISEIFSMVYNFQHLPSSQEKYPDLIKNQVYFEYSINEKIALEKAIAFTIGNKSALCVMKNVGMNVASDALMSITYQTIIAPLVIVVCDDPGCHSSSNEQDSRYWGNMASVPLFNPSTPEDAYSMTKKAFELSAALNLPVIIRSTTRVSHSRGMISYNRITEGKRTASFDRLKEHINIPAKTAAAHQKLLDKLSGETIDPYFTLFNKELIKADKKEFGIISTGVSTNYLLELISRNQLEDKISLLDLGLIFPFPEKQVQAFLNRGFKSILIIEELDPIVENAVRRIAQINSVPSKIIGKELKELSISGEYSLDLIDAAISSFLNIKTERKETLKSNTEFELELPPRPPTLCSGCPHRATYYALKLIVPRDESKVVLCGDIGCLGLGALPPLKMVDTINHMGMSISMAQGLSEALKNDGTKVVALLGDGTFFHSGITSLLNAVYSRSNMLVIIFDNRTIGMTGHQDHPGATHIKKYHEIEIAPLVRGMGIDFVETIMPFDLKKAYSKVEDAMAHDGISVLISKAPCVFLPEYEKFTRQDARIAVDPAKCNTCHNHSDPGIYCSRRSSSKSNLIRAIAKIKAEKPIDASDQTCPANICNHGFFNSILEKDYGTALEIVRDKLLFARTCGDICHRPCELFSGHKADSTIPIKQLKKYVAEIDENFKDFSGLIHRIKDLDKKEKHIAIVGAGPAGLSAAYDLIRDAYYVTVFEKENTAGGLIKHVIPDFRMNKNGFDYEVSQLEKMGVKFQFNSSLGKDIHLPELSEKFDGIILSIGLGKSKNLDLIKNQVSKSRRFDALSFLRDFNLGNLSMKKGSRYLVIGGGNSAIDVARSIKNYDSTSTVLLSCIEEEEKMPAFTEEVERAKEEEIEIVGNSMVTSCIEQEELEVTLSTYRRKKVLKKEKFDFVVEAIGQYGEKELYTALGEKNLGSDGRIKAEKENGYANYSNVFVAGDICEDNHQSLIGAIASGKRAVIGLKQKLEKYPFPFEGIDSLLNLNQNEFLKIPSEPIQSNTDLSEYLSHFNLFQSCEKCNHCIENLGCPALIKVDGKIVIEDSQCTKCGLCIDVCPNDAIHWVEEEKSEMG